MPKNGGNQILFLQAPSDTEYVDLNGLGWLCNENIG